MQNEQKTNQNLIKWVFRIGLILVDIFIVNFSYYLALLLRFYVNHQFNPEAVPYIPLFYRFAPGYTVCCIIVFAFFKLYHGIWRFAGINDANRIIKANIVTCVIQIVGTLLTVGRMPRTYYALGAMIQFMLMMAVRFSYRILKGEYIRLTRNKNIGSVNVMIIGAGESARIFLQQIYSDKDNAAQPVCVIDGRNQEKGIVFYGLPVVGGLNDIPAAAAKYNVRTAIIADSLMSAEQRETARKLCKDLEIGVQDFSGYNQVTSAIGFNQLMSITDGPVQIRYKGKTQDYENGEQAAMSWPGGYVVKEISSTATGVLRVRIDEDLVKLNNVNEAWVQSYEKETGEEISFF